MWLDIVVEPEDPEVLRVPLVDLLHIDRTERKSVEFLLTEDSQVTLQRTHRFDLERDTPEDIHILRDLRNRSPIQ